MAWHGFVKRRNKKETRLLRGYAAWKQQKKKPINISKSAAL